MQYAFDGFLLDTATRELRAGNDVVDLEPQVFDVLAHLVECRDRLVSKEELLDQVWGDRFVSESALTTRIKQARQAVGDNGRDQRLVRTVHGRGYRFVGTLVERPPQDTSSVPLRQSAPILRRLVLAREELPRTCYADSDGASIAYQVFGEGPPLLFLAGFTTNLEVQWEHPTLARFLRTLGSFARVIVMDKRGVGLSDRIHDGGPAALETRADDLRAVMDAAGVERVSVLGSSEGGALSVVFAASHPELVDRLVLHGTWARHPQFGEGEWMLDGIEKWWGTGAAFRYLSPTFAVTKEDKRFLARFERLSSTPGSARRLQELSLAIDVTDVLPAVSAPTLVIHRTGDEPVPIAMAHDVVAGIPDARLVELPGIDHWIMGGDIDQVLDAVREFVAGAPRRPVHDDRLLATVLFVDIVGSTARVRQMGDHRWAGLLDSFEHVAAETIANHQGELVSTTGDGVLAIFDGPGRGVLSALDLRRAVAPLGLEIRAGLHTAEIERRGDDIAGIGVNIASRVADAAGPGEVLVSRTLTDLVAGTGLQFRSRGSHELAGLAEPWMLFEAVD